MQLLGDSMTTTSEIDGFLAIAPSPSGQQVYDFLKIYKPEERAAVGQALVSRQVSPDTVNMAMAMFGNESWWTQNKGKVYGVLALASMAASAYHGTRRNNGSVGWGLGWGVLGMLFPVVTPAVAIAQGFGQRKGS